MLEGIYWFMTVATFMVIVTDEKVWTPLDPWKKRLFVAAVVAPFWPVILAFGVAWMIAASILR